MVYAFSDTLLDFTKQMLLGLLYSIHPSIQQIFIECLSQLETVPLNRITMTGKTNMVPTLWSLQFRGERQ